MMEQSFETTEGEPERLKVLVMGAHAAGKTAILKQTINGLRAEQLRNLLPTILLDVPPEKKKGKYLCRFFECGGQEKFFEEYHRPENEKNIFSKVNIFLFVVDSANKELFPLAHKEFWRALTKIAKYSPNALTIIFAHKQDLPKALTPKEVKELLTSPPGKIYPKLDTEPETLKETEETAKRTVCYGTSIEEPTPNKSDGGSRWTKADEAIQVTLQLYSKFMQKQPKTTQKSEIEKDAAQQTIRKILQNLNQEVRALGSALIDKSSGLQVASTIDQDEVTQNIMGIIILNSTKVLRELELGEKILNIVILRGEKYNVMLVNVTEEFTLLIVLTTETEVQLGYAIYTVSETAKKIKEALQP
jgi:predicted regulator of Ras-like GTPase activity (Roadblock/LC7/MglB family)/signal recognition particle receptor subunit beta